MFLVAWKFFCYILKFPCIRGDFNLLNNVLLSVIVVERMVKEMMVNVKFDTPYVAQPCTRVLYYKAMFRISILYT